MPSSSEGPSIFVIAAGVLVSYFIAAVRRRWREAETTAQVFEYYRARAHTKQPRGHAP